jgi:hypothetical protein
MADINRRKFLGMFGKGAAVVAVAPSLFQQVNPTEPDWEDEELSEELVEERIYQPSPPDSVPRARYGIYEQKVDPNKFKTVGEYRKIHSKVWAIPEDAKAFVNGNKTSESYRLKEFDRLEFVRISGRR